MNKNKQPSNAEQIEELAQMALGIDDGDDERFAEGVDAAFMNGKMALLGGLAARIEHYYTHDPSTIDDVIAGKSFMHLAAKRDVVSSRINFMTKEELAAYLDAHDKMRDELREPAE